ncbi:MAG: ATP-binding cassette domain-containing protein, partial [Hyphomicrobiales bacterium]
SKVFRLVLQTAIMGVGAWLVIDGKISGGSIFAASMLMGRALGPVEQVVANWKPLLEARAAYARLNQLFAENEAPSISMGLPSPRGHVTVENISVVNRESGQTLLRNVSFGAEPGTVLAVAGHSGAGKSTLLRALVGAVLPDDGHVRMDGFSLRHWDPDRLGAHVGYLPQEITLYAGTVAENIARMGHPDSGKVLAAAEGAGLHQLIQRLPTGYDTRIGPGGLPLSGGFRQRIALARALYGDPCLLILDEPTAHLDTEGEQSVIKVMQACRARGATVVFSSHTNRLIAVADRALLLRDGQIQSLGNVEFHKGDTAVRPPMAVPTSNPQDMLHAAVRAVAL